MVKIWYFMGSVDKVCKYMAVAVFDLAYRVILNKHKLAKLEISPFFSPVELELELS